MNNLCRFYLTLGVTSLITGCSSIHNSIGPDKPVSDMRASVEAPVELSGDSSPFCAKPDMEIPAAPVIARAPAFEPYQARLYFLLDKTEFTPESKLESKRVYDKILKLDPKEIVIVGHTDTAASNAYNDALSQRRAEKVRQDLIDLGVSDDVMKISSEGEYNLLVVTPDNTVEERNRRVEINVR